MVLLVDIIPKWGIGELGINGEVLLGSELGITAEVDAEHTLSAPLCRMYTVLHVVVVLVRSCALLGSHGTSNEFKNTP